MFDAKDYDEWLVGGYKELSLKSGRNNPCPCGSGKKHKKCCHGKLKMDSKFQPLRQQAEVAAHSVSGQEEISTLALLFNQQRYIEAESLALSLIQRFSHNGFVWMVLGTTLILLGRSADALAPMQRAVALSPDDANAHNNLGSILQDIDRLDEAEASYRQAIQIKPDYVDAHYNLGNILQKLGQLNEAETSYRRAIQIKSDFANAHFNLGIIFNDLGRPDEAEASYRLAIQIKPDYVEAHYNLGSILQKLCQLDEAEANYRRTIQIKPDFYAAHNNLGCILLKSGRLDEAKTSYRRAIQIKPDFAEAHNNLGNTLHEMGRLDKAEASYRQAIQINPDFAGAHNNLGKTLQELGRLDESEASYQRALQIKPDFAEAHHDLGITLQELGRLNEAQSSYRRAIQIKPEFAEAHINLGRVLQEMGCPNDATASYQRALQIKSDYAPSISSPPVTALLPFGRSGSLFFHSLFDGHPEIATLPGVYFKGWFGMDRWKHFAPNMADSDWKKRLVETILREYQPMFDARCTKNVVGKPMGNSSWLAKELGFMDMGTDRSQHFVVDQEAFKAACLSLLAPFSVLGQKDCFEVIHRAFEIAIRGNTAFGAHNNGHIFYHIHNPDPFEFAHFLQHYPQARLLHIMRNPVQSMESWMLIGITAGRGALNSANNTDADSKVAADYKINCWNRMILRVVNMFINMQSPFNNLAYSRGVRLEDVKRNAQRVMPQIAAWMGISDHPALYEASFYGLQYWGPASKESGNITGFDTKAIDRPVGRLLGPRDIIIFETLFWPFSQLYGYIDLNEAGFRLRLAEIRPWLDEPLEFEARLYAELPVHSSAIEDMSAYMHLHRLLHQFWTVLDREGNYQGMVQPLELS